LNDKFFILSKEKQNLIINAGFRVFAENTYIKSPMSEIAREANISKALLFHYFKNKKELYLYLYDYAMNMIMEMARREVTVNERDFFEIFLKSVKYKCELTKEHPYLSRFIMKPYYEADADLADELKEKNINVANTSIHAILNRVDRNKFKDEVDVEQLINIVIWCGEGYMKENYKDLEMNIDKVEKGYERIIDFFRKSSYKEEYLP
jgi:TetR/AcrR family transcriptional regulator